MFGNPTKLYHIDDSRGKYRYHPIQFRPLSSTIDYLSIETFQQRCTLSMWSQQFTITYSKSVYLQCSCYFAPVARHSIQTMCTMFSRKDFLRMFDGLLRTSTRKTNVEPRCLTLLVGHNGAIFAANHLELVHAHHLANPYKDLANSLW